MDLRISAKMSVQRDPGIDWEYKKSVPDRIGIVDSDSAVRHSTRMLLEVHGFLADEFESAAALLESPLCPHLSCLVVDQQIPDVTGLELVERLHAQGIATPVILTAERPASTLADRIRRAGVVALLIKPIQHDELLSWINHIGRAHAK